MSQRFWEVPYFTLSADKKPTVLLLSFFSFSKGRTIGLVTFLSVWSGGDGEILGYHCGRCASRVQSENMNGWGAKIMSSMFYQSIHFYVDARHWCIWCIVVSQNNTKKIKGGGEMWGFDWYEIKCILPAVHLHSRSMVSDKHKQVGVLESKAGYAQIQ